jgi:hypothetical protein
MWQDRILMRALEDVVGHGLRSATELYCTPCTNAANSARNAMIWSTSARNGTRRVVLRSLAKPNIGCCFVLFPARDSITHLYGLGNQPVALQ